MSISLRLWIGVAILGALLAVIGVVGGRGSLKPTEGTQPRGQKVNRIAYVGLDAQIRTVSPDGSDPRQLSPQAGFFTWPTWSPDGRRLVFSGVVERGARDIRISLYLLDPAAGPAREIYVGAPGIAGLLAEGVVHYPLWSPDSQKVAFIAVTPRGLSLFLDDLQESVDAEFILDQGPLWMSWSPDSRYLLVHRGADHFLVNTLDGNRVSLLAPRAFAYRVPAWRPGAATVTLLSESASEGYALYTAKVNAAGIDGPRLLAQVPQDAAFLWSPTGALLAVAGPSSVLNYQGLSLLVYSQLSLLSGGSPVPAAEIKDNILAYFWSPNGAKLAYVTLSDRRGVLRWMVMDVATGDRWRLVDFVPSQDQLTMFQFFDQYAYSHSLWSPDSRSLVFAGRLVDGAVAASVVSHPGGQGSHVVVLDTSPDPKAEAIAEGILAFWSPK